MGRIEKPKSVRPKDREVTHVSLRERFSTEEQCQELFIKIRWPSGVTCLRCGFEKVYRIGPPLRFVCGARGCGHKFSVTAGTWLHGTKISLVTWVWAFYALIENSYGISATQLARQEEIKPDTALTMFHTLRMVMEESLLREPPLSGIVEVDESDVGGKGSGHWTRRNAGKSIVWGITEHGGGRVFLEVGTGRSQAELVAFIRRHTGQRLKGIYTDGHKAYQNVGEIFGVPHESVNHSAGEYVRGDVYTNSIESIWATLDRMLFTTYEHASRKYLPLYLAECAWRHNHRHEEYRHEDFLYMLLSKPMYYGKTD